MSTLRFWVAVQDGRGKWGIHYDPRYEIKDGERFAFETTAKDYVKKQERSAKDAEKRLAERQASLMGEVQGE